MLKKDKKLIEKLYTFDRIYLVGLEGLSSRQQNDSIRTNRARTNSQSKVSAQIIDISMKNPLSKASFYQIHDHRFMSNKRVQIVPTHCDMSSVLGDSSFSTLLYNIPNVIGYFSPEILSNTPELTRGGGGGSVQDFFSRSSSVSTSTSLSSSSSYSISNTALSTDTAPHKFNSSPSLILPSLDSSTADSPNNKRPLLVESPVMTTRNVHKRSSMHRRSTADVTTSITIATPSDTLSSDSPLVSPNFRSKMDLISKVQSVKDRVLLTLHKFFERSLTSLMDGEIVFKVNPDKIVSKTSSIHIQQVMDGLNDSKALAGGTDIDGDLLCKIQNVIREKAEMLVSSTLFEGIDNSLCFVKIQSPDSFMLLFLPIFKVDMASSNSNSSVSAENLRFLSLTIFECRRANPASPIEIEPLPFFSFENHTALKPPFAYPQSCKSEFKWNLNLPPNGDMYNEPITDGTIVMKGQFGNISQVSSESNGDKSSDQYMKPNAIADSFVQLVSSAYLNAFFRTIYSSFLQGICIRARDLDTALNFCVEHSVDIDITGYLNVQTLKFKQHGKQGRRYFRK